MGDAVAGHRDVALDQGLACRDGLGNGSGGRHVLTDQTEVGGSPAGGHLQAGQHLYQLTLAAFGVNCRYPDQRDIPALAELATGAERLKRRAHLVFDCDDDPLRAQGPAKNTRAEDDLAGLFAHQHFITADPGFALDTVQYQRVRFPLASIAHFCVGWKYRAAETGQPAILHLSDQAVRAGVLPVAERFKPAPLFPAIGPDDHARTRLARRV